VSVIEGRACSALQADKASAAKVRAITFCTDFWQFISCSSLFCFKLLDIAALRISFAKHPVRAFVLSLRRVEKPFDKPVLSEAEGLRIKHPVKATGTEFTFNNYKTRTCFLRPILRAAGESSLRGVGPHINSCYLLSVDLKIAPQ
jgi:hypothetical protein